jgi:phosphatidate cytidylyltransferase
MTDGVPARWPHGLTSFEQRFGNATTRVVVGAIAIPIIFGAVWLGGWAFFIFVAAITVGALLEFYWLLEKKGARPNKGLGVAASLLMSLAFMHGVTDSFVSLMHMMDKPPTEAFLLGRFAMVIGIMILFGVAVMIIEMFKGEGSPLLNNIATFAGISYVSLFLSTLIGIRQLFTSVGTGFMVGRPIDYTRDYPTVMGEINRNGFYTVMAVLVSIWVCDSAAYYAGRAFGRHKLFERVSPKKTWEGAIAGAIAAIAPMIIVQQTLLPFFTIVDAIVIGIIAGVFGQLGDLAESHLKRDAGVKDSSALIPGHGGLFDRFDSLLFVAPLVYVYLNVIMLTR